MQVSKIACSEGELSSVKAQALEEPQRYDSRRTRSEERR